MNGLSEKEIKVLRNLLVTEQEEIERHFVLEGEGIQEGSITDSTGELSAYDNHPADLGTETFERERDTAIDDKFKERQLEVEQALARMDQGTYGKCEVCGGEIGFERLEALPMTPYCIKDVPDPSETPGTGRPIEEEVMTPPPSGAGDHRQEAGRFDDADAWKSVQDYGNSSDEQQTGLKHDAEKQASKLVNE